MLNFISLFHKIASRRPHTFRAATKNLATFSCFHGIRGLRPPSVMPQFSGQTSPEVEGAEVWLVKKGEEGYLEKTVTDFEGRFSFKGYYSDLYSDYEFFIPGDVGRFTKIFQLHSPSYRQWNGNPNIWDTKINYTILPDEITDLSKTVVDEHLAYLEWTNIENAYEYDIYLGAWDGIAGEVVWQAHPTHTVARGVTRVDFVDNPYSIEATYYRVLARNEAGPSPYSNEVSIDFPFPEVPLASTNLENTVNSQTSIKLTWDNAHHNGDGIKILRSLSGAGGTWTTIDTIPADSVEYVSDGLTQGVEYYHKVVVFNDLSGDSPDSNVVNIVSEIFIYSTDLMFHIDASNPASYTDPGTVWTDIEGSKNSNTISGPTYDSDKGGLFLFNGSNYISWPSPGTEFGFYSGFVGTIEVIWKFIGGQTNGPLIGNERSGSSYEFGSLNVSGNRVGFITQTLAAPPYGWWVYTADNMLPGWNYVGMSVSVPAATGTMESNSCLNGATNEDSANITVSGWSTPNLNLDVGRSRNYTYGTSYMDGGIALIRMYSERLTNAQLLNNYAFYNSKFEF